MLRNPELGDALERLGREGAEAYYRGNVAGAVSDWLDERGGSVTRAALAGYGRGRASRRGGVPRPRGAHQPAALGRRDAAGLRAGPARPPSRAARAGEAVAAMCRPPRQSARRSSSTGSARRGSSRASSPLAWGPGPATQRATAGGGPGAASLGSTTHISVLDDQGRACSVTCTNGEGPGVVVPGDRHPPEQHHGRAGSQSAGLSPPPRRAPNVPSMMAPSIVTRAGGRWSLVLGSAGSNRIRSALLQTIVGVVDHGLRRPRGGARPAGALRGGRRCTPSRGSTCAALARRGPAGGEPSTRSTSSSAACRPYSAATGSCWAPATPAGAGWQCRW